MKNVCERSANSKGPAARPAPTRGCDSHPAPEGPAPIRHLIEDIVADVFGVSYGRKLVTAGIGKAAYRGGG